MTIKDFEIGDYVKVKEQEIYGEIVKIHYDTNEIVIEDDASEYESPDDQLVYRPDEIETFKMRIGG
jgi:vacuolar-type H+-ATPase catalytic subunit A/Vma1